MIISRQQTDNFVEENVVYEMDSITIFIAGTQILSVLISENIWELYYKGMAKDLFMFHLL